MYRVYMVYGYIGHMESIRILNHSGVLYVEKQQFTDDAGGVYHPMMQGGCIIR